MSTIRITEPCFFAEYLSFLKIQIRFNFMERPHFNANFPIKFYSEFLTKFNFTAVFSKHIENITIQADTSKYTLKFFKKLNIPRVQRALKDGEEIFFLLVRILSSLTHLTFHVG